MRTTADIDQLQTTKTRVWSIFKIAARADRAAIAMARLGLIVVLLWIGGLKAFKYEGCGHRAFCCEQSSHELLLCGPGPLQGAAD